jgi:hypothetical protein
MDIVNLLEENATSQNIFNYGVFIGKDLTNYIALVGIDHDYRKEDEKLNIQKRVFEILSKRDAFNYLKQEAASLLDDMKTMASRFPEERVFRNLVTAFELFNK